MNRLMNFIDSFASLPSSLDRSRHKGEAIRPLCRFSLAGGAWDC